MPFSSDVDSTIFDEVTEEYQKAAFWLPFSALEIKKVFNESQLEELSQFLAEVKAAGSSNKKKTQAIEKYSGAALKLMSLAKLVV